MILQVVIHKEEEGYWAEVPALKGCFTQGATIDEIKSNIREAIDGWFLVDLPTGYDEIIEVAV